MRKSDAVSELVGSILLVSLVVLAVAIIGVGFLSQPPPVQLQELNVLASYDNGTLYLYHDGGDDMVGGEFQILLDNDPDPKDFEEVQPLWRIGERRSIGGINEEPERIQLISLRGGQKNLIREIRIIPGAPPITPGPAPTPGPGGGCTQEELDEYAQEYLEDNYVDYFSDQLDNDAVYFTRLERGPTGQTYITGWVNITINSTNSYLIRSTTGKMNLNLGDAVSIFFRNVNQGSADIFSVGNKGWSFSGDATEIYVNNILVSGYLVDSWITSFTNYQSTLRFKSVGTGGGSQTRLIVENETKVDQVNNNNYEFINIRPAEPTLLILNFPSEQGKPIRFIGKVDEIKEGTTTIYP